MSHPPCPWTRCASTYCLVQICSRKRRQVQLADPGVGGGGWRGGGVGGGGLPPGAPGNPVPTHVTPYPNPNPNCLSPVTACHLSPPTNRPNILQDRELSHPQGHPHQAQSQALVNPHGGQGADVSHRACAPLSNSGIGGTRSPETTDA